MEHMLSYPLLKAVKMITALTIFLAQFCHSGCLITWTFYMADNHTLQNHVFKTITDSSPVICGRECSTDPNCMSFNYHARGSTCELNNVTRKQSLCDFKVLPGSLYYDGDRATSILSAADSVKYTGCQELLTAGHCDNGIYTIYPAGLTNGIQVYCDMETDGGGWMVFQRRQDGSVDFYRTWDEYKHGFGNLSGEFWLGNEALRILTRTGQWQLRVDLWDWEGNTAWAGYGEFAISGDKYTLHIGSYTASGVASVGDSMKIHNGHTFTTKDQDNDWEENANCARRYKGAWWFNRCFNSHLNGKYYMYHNGSVPNAQGIQWYHMKESHYYSVKQCNMKMRSDLPLPVGARQGLFQKHF